MNQLGFFGEEECLEKLSKLGDCLEKLDIINWEMFRPLLNQVFKKERKSNAGRPPFDYLLMFKIVILQRLFNLGDDKTEYQIIDRRSFMRFLGLIPGDRVPDAKTIWAFKDNLANSGAMEELFSMFEQELEDAGYITHTGTIVDATFVDAPRQRNHREETQTIKEGGIPEEWQADTPEAKHKLSQKDTDARWTKKGGETHYGYKDHAKVDVDSKLIVNYAVTDASVHDSRRCAGLIDGKDNALWADCAYSSKEIAESLPEHVENHIHERAYRGQPLTEEQKENNRKKSKIRARIEHVFGFITGSMNGITVRSIGMTRARFNISLTNLVYNMCRYAYLARKRVIAMG